MHKECREKDTEGVADILRVSKRVGVSDQIREWLLHVPHQIQMRIADSQHNIVLRKCKGYMFQLNMFSHRLESLQEC